MTCTHAVVHANAALLCTTHCRPNPKAVVHNTLFGQTEERKYAVGSLVMAAAPGTLVTDAHGLDFWYRVQL